MTGGQSLCKALLENTTLEHLILTSNELSEPTAAAMAQVAIHNSTLRKVDLSCNTLGQVSHLHVWTDHEHCTLIRNALRCCHVCKRTSECTFKKGTCPYVILNISLITPLFANVIIFTLVLSDGGLEFSK